MSAVRGVGQLTSAAPVPMPMPRDSTTTVAVAVGLRRTVLRLVRGELGAWCGWVVPPSTESLSARFGRGAADLGRVAQCLVS